MLRERKSWKETWWRDKEIGTVAERDNGARAARETEKKRRDRRWGVRKPSRRETDNCEGEKGRTYVSVPCVTTKKRIGEERM